VFAAVDAIKNRTNSAGQPAPRQDTEGVDTHSVDTPPRRPGRRNRRGGTPTHQREIGPLGTLALHRLAAVSPESLLTTAEAATIVGMSAATIRSWVRRGHLAPSRTSTARGLRFRLTDVYDAARRS
jgi:excisionase family DNA binding protein